jgi:glucose 1-dehydrogenase
MRSVAVDYSRRELVERDTSEPAIASPGDVLFAMREVGVCGTDRELAACRIGVPPEGSSYLIQGHEALGQVIRVGDGVETLSPGDWVVPAIRRSCRPACASCARGRRDLCLSGNFLERGIFRLHGYLTDLAVDEADDLIRVPENLVPYAVLLEPLSVVEKAVAVGLTAHPGEPKRALVLGAGPVGLLAALVLKARRLDVSISSLEPESHPRAALIRDTGIEYGRLGPADIVIEATGSADAAIAGFRSLAPLGVYVILGAPNTHGDIPFEQLIVNNQHVVGSLNASPEAFRSAVEDLGRFDRRVLDCMIERLPWSEYRRAICGPPPDRPKVVLVRE